MNGFSPRSMFILISTFFVQNFEGEIIRSQFADTPYD